MAWKLIYSWRKQRKKRLIFNFIKLFVVFLSIILWKILMKIAFQFPHSLLLLLSRGRIMTAINLIFYEKISCTRFAHNIAYDLTMITESVVFIRSLKTFFPIKKKKLFLSSKSSSIFLWAEKIFNFFLSFLILWHKRVSMQNGNINMRIYFFYWIFMKSCYTDEFYRWIHKKVQFACNSKLIDKRLIIHS